MITTPLSPIVAHLRKHGASLACLEGAPWTHTETTSLLSLREPYERPTSYRLDAALYLGTGSLCPAALGWAAEVLALGRGWTEPDLMIYGEDVIGLRGWQESMFHEWQWKPSDPSCWDNDVHPDLITVMPGPMPTTPAARLKAVLEHEVRR